MQNDQYVMTINGKAVQAAETFDVSNPATEEVIAQAPNASKEDLDNAVAAAREAFKSWSQVPVEERRDIVRKIGKRIEEHGEELARLLTREQGKPVEAAMGEVVGSTAFADGMSDIEIPVLTQEDNEERFIETRYMPIGVVGAIAPWNFPLFLAMGKVISSLITGNTVVLKPSPFTPLTTLRVGQLVNDLLPPGVLNVISGDDRLGPWLTAHDGIDKISFTGSSATGSKVMSSAADGLKRVTLELGGNDAAIVLADADIAAITEPLFWSAFMNSGQVCVASKRIYVHNDIYDELSAALVEYAKNVVVGDGSQQGTMIGPINNPQQFNRVRDLIEDAKKNGLNFLVGGEVTEQKGYFIPVSLIDNPPEDSRIVAEEQFGPVVPLLRFSDIDEVIDRANATDYGLGGSIWSRDIKKAAELARRLDTGTVWINGTQYNAPTVPFGGHKSSGIGSEFGIDGLMGYMNPQVVVVHKQTAPAA